MSAKFFYDRRGSELFEAITTLPEYYLTRTEMQLFATHREALAQAIGSDAALVEYGSGSSKKIRQLLETAGPSAYVPVDISREHLEQHARLLFQDFPWMSVYPTCADITRPFDLPEPVAELEKVGFYPGSSIGNFNPEAATGFLQNVADTLGPGARLIIGVDRKKDRAVLEAAYNDSAGVTAEFNLNLIRHLGLLLDAEFDPEQFVHRASYNDALGCIQMFLEATVDHEITVAGRRIQFAAGEALHTENSFKYHSGEFLDLAAKAGFSPLEEWTDPKEWFSIFLLEVSG